MGWRYRKSVKLPLGFRLNFSKSGMGWSWGVKGARITKTATGKTRYTATYPGGLQYIEERGPKRKQTPRRRPASSGQWNTPGQNGPEPPKKRSGCLKWGLIVLGGMIVITAIGQALGIIEPEEDTSSSAPETSIISEISSEPESSALPEETSVESEPEPSAEKPESSVPAVSTPVEESSTPESSEPVIAVPSEPSSEPVEESSEPAEEPQATLSFTSIPTSVARNSDATVSIHGLPNTDYYISVRYSSGTATADGLGAKTSDADGNVSWTWHIGGRTSLDYDPVITVSGGGEEITARFTVTD